MFLGRGNEGKTGFPLGSDPAKLSSIYLFKVKMGRDGSIVPSPAPFSRQLTDNGDVFKRDRFQREITVF